jgi:hypothetical protein
MILRNVLNFGRKVVKKVRDKCCLLGYPPMGGVYLLRLCALSHSGCRCIPEHESQALLASILFLFSCCFLLLFSHYYSSSSRFTVIYSSLVVGIDSVSTDFWLNSSAQSNQPSEKSQKHTHNTAPFFLSFPSCK